MSGERCALCGATGELAALDGLCADRVACWSRWDAAHGLTNTEAQRQMAARQAVA